MNNITLSLTITLFAGQMSMAAQNPPDSEWTRLWDAGHGDWAAAGFVAIAPDGSVYVAGTTGGTDQDLALIRYDAEGNELWVKTYDGPGSGDDVPTDIELTNEGVSIVGTSPGLEGPQTVLLDFDADGAIIGEKRTIGPAMAGFLRPQLAIGVDGRRVIATDDDTGAGVVEAYAPDGTLIFQTSYVFGGFSGMSALELDEDLNAVFVTVEGFSVYIVRKLDPLGEELWSHTEMSGTGLVLGDAYIALAPDGEVVIAGSPEIPCVTVKARVWRHAADGEVQWARNLPEEDCEFGIAVGLAAGSDGDVYLAASGAIPTSFITRLDGDGDITWNRTLGGDGLSIGLRDIALGPAGDVFVGASQAPEDQIAAFDILVQSYDSSGEFLWSSVFDGPGGQADFISAVTAGDDGTVAVTGTARHEGTFQNIVTRAFGFSTPCPADVTDDDTVDVLDLLEVLTAWGECYGCPADITGDGEVDVLDLIEVLAAWGPCESTSP